MTTSGYSATSNSGQSTSAAGFSAVELITAKRDGQTLTSAQIRWLIENYVLGVVAEEQMSAMAMAILWRGMSPSEIRALTSAMIASGQTLDFSDLGTATTDKHSTGGVGDKITLPLAPLVASFGVAVPQLSGRGLGHTGGTLDKLESISGWRASLSIDQLMSQLKTTGAAVCAAGENLAPADRKLYALRDVTGTVESIPLIAASIMSKKLAEGTKALVLDVKVGSGAFMKTQSQAKELAQTMVDLGNHAGVSTSAFITNMDTPLGYTAGNAIEVEEALEVLAGGGPADVVELTVVLATEMLRLAGVQDANVREALANGKAMDKWRQMIAAQGGDPSAKLPTAQNVQQIFAPSSGKVGKLDALQVGLAAWKLGAGRKRREDSVQKGAGVRWFVKEGDVVTVGQKVFELYTDTPEAFEAAEQHLQEALQIVGLDTNIEPKPLVLDTITL